VIRESGLTIIELELELELKVTDFATNRKLACNFLLVNNTNLQSILYHFQVIAHYWPILTKLRIIGQIFASTGDTSL